MLSYGPFVGSGQFPIINCNGLTPLPSISPGRRSPYPLKGNLSRREHLQTTNSYCRYPVVFWYSSLVTGIATSKMRCGAYVGRSKTRRNPTETGHPLQYQNLPRRLDHVLPIWIRRLGTERGVVTPCTTHLSFKTCASHYPKSSFCFFFYSLSSYHPLQALRRSRRDVRGRHGSAGSHQSLPSRRRRKCDGRCSTE